GAGREPRRAELSHATDDEKEERMRLVTFETNGRARLGVEWQDRILDLHDAYELARLWKGIPRDPGAASAREALWRSSMRAFLEAGEPAWTAAREAISVVEELAAGGWKPSPSSVAYPRGAVRLKAPVPDPPKIICLGLNYRDHAAESGAEVPTE